MVDKKHPHLTGLFMLKTLMIGHLHALMVAFGMSRDEVLAELDAFYEEAAKHVSGIDVER